MHQLEFCTTKQYLFQVDNTNNNLVRQTFKKLTFLKAISEEEGIFRFFPSFQCGTLNLTLTRRIPPLFLTHLNTISDYISETLIY